VFDVQVLAKETIMKTIALTFISISTPPVSLAMVMMTRLVLFVIHFLCKSVVFVSRLYNTIQL